jgi:GT2 family glycosyltransferase
VIIPHYDDARRLARCLAGLVPQVSADIEVVVVDNASPTPPQVPPEMAAQVRLVTEPASGAAMARNRGVAETRAPLLFFLDCDCVPAPDWIATARRVVGQSDLVGGEITVFDETPAPRSGAEAFETVFAFDNRGYIARKGFSVTANLLTSRAVFDAVGGFRAGLSEDLEWCQRATTAGFSLSHAQDLCVSHPTRSDWPALRRKWHRLTEEAWGLVRDQPGARLKWAFRACLMPFSAIAHIPRVARAPALSGGGERWRGIATLMRLRLARSGWMLRQAIGR